jgi:hypothetical protein
MGQAQPIEQVEHRAVLVLVGGDPVAAAVRALPERDTFRLGVEQVATEILAGVLEAEVVQLVAGAVGLVLLGQQQAVVGRVAP